MAFVIVFCLIVPAHSSICEHNIVSSTDNKLVRDGFFLMHVLFFSLSLFFGLLFSSFVFVVSQQWMGAVRFFHHKLDLNKQKHLWLVLLLLLAVVFGSIYVHQWTECFLADLTLTFFLLFISAIFHRYSFECRTVDWDSECVCVRIYMPIRKSRKTILRMPWGKCEKKDSQFIFTPEQKWRANSKRRFPSTHILRTGCENLFFYSSASEQTSTSKARVSHKPFKSLEVWLLSQFFLCLLQCCHLILYTTTAECTFLCIWQQFLSTPELWARTKIFHFKHINKF